MSICKYAFFLIQLDFVISLRDLGPIHIVSVVGVSVLRQEQAEIFMENASHSYVTLKNSLQLKACLSHFVRHFESFLALFITLFHLVKLQF